MSKKIVLEGFFEYAFNGTMGQTVFHLNNTDLDRAITRALEEADMITIMDYNINAYSKFTAGKIRITVEQLED